MLYEYHKKVKEYYDECKSMRPDSFEIQLDYPAEAFIAYPTLHYYINGYHIEVTAGSGNDDLQKNLLQNIANITLEKLIQITDMDIDNTVISDDSVDLVENTDNNE